MIGGRGGQAYLVSPDDIISGRPLMLVDTVILHERGPLFRILGPPKQQVSNIFKKFQRKDSRLVILHDILCFLCRFHQKSFNFLWSSICLENQDFLFSFYQPFYWPWIFNLHFSLEPSIVEACHMAHLNPVSLKINLKG